MNLFNYAEIVIHYVSLIALRVQVLIDVFLSV